MLSRLTCGVVTFFLCLGFVRPGFAQEGSASGIEQRVGKQLQKLEPQLPPEELILTGEDDLVLLRRRKFFTVKLDSSFGYVSNAYSSDDNKKHDEVVNENLSLRFETKIAEKYTVFADAGAFLARHVRFTDLNYDGVTGNLGARVPSGPWTFGFGYRASAIIEPGLDTRIVTQNSTSASASYGIAIDKNTSVVPSASASRVWASPDDFTNTSVRLGAAVVHRVAPDLMASLSVQGVKRWYDNYYEETNNQTRRDVGFDASLSLRWTPSENVSMSISSAVGYIDSTLNSSDYFNFSITPMVTLQINGL